MTTVLVPLDGSELAGRALPFAATIAGRAGWSVLLLRAVDAHGAPMLADAAPAREARKTLDAAAASLAREGITVVTRVVDQRPDAAILEAIAEHNASLVVMATHGRGGLGRWIYGSVADTVIRHAPVPVMTVPPHGIEIWPTHQPISIMVPLDGSELSRAALGPACDLADILGGSLLLASVVTFPSYAAYAEGYTFIHPDPGDSVLVDTRAYLEELAAEVRTDTRRVEICATYGSPYFGISTIARDRGAGLLVMATHGRGGMTRALLGSVASAAIHDAEIPIVLVRPTAAAAARRSQETGERAEAEPAITLALSGDEVELLKRVVADRFYNQPVDPRFAEPIRLLLDKLRAAGAEPTDRTLARSGR